MNESMRNVTNSLYCEYVRRMFLRIDEMVEAMKAENEEYFSDIFKVSSTVLLEIFHEFMPNEVPEYFTILTYSDYFGEKVVGCNAIAKIINAWENERKQFSIDKKKNRLVYTYPEGANTYELKYICDELPPKLNARVASRCLVMDLDKARDFFELRFRKFFLRGKHEVDGANQLSWCAKDCIESSNSSANGNVKIMRMSCYDVIGA